MPPAPFPTTPTPSQPLQPHPLSDGVWTKYAADAPSGAEAILYEKLEILVDKTKGAEVAQPPALNTVEALLAASDRHNERVHEVLRTFMVRCGGVYKEGPIKDAKRA